MRPISLRTANQEFSKLIREVEHGSAFLITRRGRPIAKLVPHTADRSDDAEWAAAFRRMMARLEEGASLGGLRMDRNQLHERLEGASPSRPTSLSMPSTWTAANDTNSPARSSVQPRSGTAS